MAKIIKTFTADYESITDDKERDTYFTTVFNMLYHGFAGKRLGAWLRKNVAGPVYCDEAHICNDDFCETVCNGIGSSVVTPKAVRLAARCVIADLRASGRKDCKTPFAARETAFAY
jgi:hypothetical protein